MKNVVVLGSTGSIGEQTLQIASDYPDQIRIVGLAANRNLERLVEQGGMFPEATLVAVDPAPGLTDGVRTGEAAMIEMACQPEVDLVVAAIVGAGGLNITLAALKSGKLVALANKESLVMAGPVIKRQLEVSGRLVPIDSEHSAIWQCIQGESTSSVEKIVLTASGGAFRDFSAAELDQVSPQQALAHPTWKMGPKVTVDSATLMNKGLEVVEATLLFDLPMDAVDVLMHRESIVHSLVYFSDSSVKAQLGLPDMRLPIQYALAHPERWENSLERLDLAAMGRLHFGPVPERRYPCLELAIEAGNRGETYPAALCAADEVAVDLFLRGAISFTSIPHLVAHTLEKHDSVSNPDLDDILEADRIARRVAMAAAGRLGGTAVGAG